MNACSLADCWIGCDRTVPIKLKVNELTRAEREGRTNRGKVVPAAKEEAAPTAAAANGKASDSEEDESEEEGKPCTALSSKEQQDSFCCLEYPGAVSACGQY